MKTRYGIARGYSTDEFHNEIPYYFIAECYIDHDDVVGCTPATIQGFESEEEAIRTLSTVVMDIMGRGEVVDTKLLRRKGSIQWR
jgi:hypothetical protein